MDSQKSVLAIHKHVATDLITNFTVASISPDLSCRSGIAGSGGIRDDWAAGQVALVDPRPGHSLGAIPVDALRG